MNRPWLKNYAEHVPRSIDYPYKTVQQLLVDTSRRYPDYVSVTFNDLSFTYQELNQKVNAFAGVLGELGIKKGDRVALILPNTPTYVICFFAILKIGAVVVNINVGSKGAELLSALKTSGPRIAITLDLFVQNVLEAAADTDIEHVIIHSVLGLETKMQLPPQTPKLLVYSELVEGRTDSEPKVQVSTEDPAILQFTSGSTGCPKAAVLSHRNVVASVLQTDAWIGLNGRGNASVICIIPFFHVFGMSACMLISVLKGYRMVLMPVFSCLDVLPVMNAIATHRPLSFPAVPSLWAALVSIEGAAERLSLVEVPTSGGALLPEWVAQKFQSLTGRKIATAYGLSEASSATHFSPYPHGGPVDSIGLPLPDTDAKIVDMEEGNKVCEVGEIGELVVKGPQIMKGYWNDPVLTRKALSDGWLYTGDLAWMDEEGFFYLVNRKDDLIISGGFNVYPSQIEKVLLQHPDVEDVAVIGVSDRIKGQAIVAVLVLKEGVEENRGMFMEYCRDRLPDTKVPHHIYFRKEIPKDPAGKQLRRVLREHI